jgi:fumarylacetoacetase
VTDAGDFPLENLPFGVFSPPGERPRAGVALGDEILDLAGLARAGWLEEAVPGAARVFDAPALNEFLRRGRSAWRATRERLIELLGGERERVRRWMLPRSAVRLHVPVRIGDYADFYSSIEHATNVGKLFRPGAEPLTPNYRYLPLGYHGRASTVTVETRVRRPHGQVKVPSEATPRFGPTAQLDFELELGFVIGTGNPDGTPISPAAAHEHLFGAVLLNDWSARDIQAWEGQPLGPFLSKSFATTISPWIVTLDALAPYRVPNRLQDPPALEHLRVDEPWAFDIDLAVDLATEAMRRENTEPAAVTRVNFRGMYWNAAQQLAHLTSNGSIVRAGDLFGSGTISGTQPGSYGSLLETTSRGAAPIVLPGGETRTFLQDGDAVVMRAAAARPGLPRIGFGRLAMTVLPAQGALPASLE